MIKNLCYLYLGENGTILSPVKLETIQYVKKYTLLASPGHQLTQDGETFYDSITIPFSDVDLWYEVEKLGQD